MRIKKNEAVDASIHEYAKMENHQKSVPGENESITLKHNTSEKAKNKPIDEQKCKYR